MAGVPFEVVERVATRETSRVARDFLVRQNKVADAESAQLAALLKRELEKARTLLLESAREILSRYLIFGTESMREMLRELPVSAELSLRNHQARKRERHLLLYLQRLAAKNDTFSEFGPSGWGKIDAGVRGLKIDIQRGIAMREAFLERWTAHAMAAAMNNDPEIQAELSPRLNSNVFLHQNKIIFVDTGESLELSPPEIETVRRCDGRTSAHSLGVPIENVRALAERRILRCEMEVPALEPHAFAVLCEDVEKWRTGPAREKWLSILQPISQLPAKFAAAAETEDRQFILDEVRTRLQSLGAVRKPSDRFLYSATNPIGEECFRECNFAISTNLVDEVAAEAAPWIDFWRDSFAFIAHRVAFGLRQLLEKAPIKNGAMPLPAFLRLCETAKLPLTGPGLVALAHMAFQEVKAAFREQMKLHADEAEYELTADDCHFVRNNFQYPRFDEYTYPSADLQIAADSIDAVARGKYQWVVSELHPPGALLHHAGYWSCPDKPALGRALASTACGRPSFHFGFFAADFTSHTAVRLFDAMPELSNFVAPQRANLRWRAVSPAEAEVYVDETSGDVCVRKIESKERLGSFARAWIIPLGFHPFQFGMVPHMPRLRCGKVIVQRRTWTITQDELGAGNYTGVSRDLVLAIERLRAQKDWPRFVYIRPTEQALRRSGAEGRDKDTKPVFVDLESYLFLEIFHRWLTKSGELEVTEMLPDPDHLLWKEPDGRRTFELRTLIVPRS